MSLIPFNILRKFTVCPLFNKYPLFRAYKYSLFRSGRQFPLVRYLSAVLAGITLLTAPMTVRAGVKEDNIAIHQAVPVESNQLPGWPQGPTISARSAILIEAETGTILYAKNIHNQEYPASTTKILTALIASERCQMDEMVTFSHDAIYDTPYDSNHIALDVGESITMEQCLNAILIRSANEVSYGVAEHITGTCWEDFASIMNERAKELGAINTNFVNPNGLPDENHYTTAYDLAMIGKAFFANEILCNMTTTRMLKIPASDTQPDNITEVNQMGLVRGNSYAYEYLVGCKTGYTNASRSSLISCAQKDGMKLICVVLRDEAPYQYEDTLALYEYGFSNFQKLNVSQHDTKYQMDSQGLFYSEKDIFGSSKSILTLNSEDYIVIPNSADFADISSSISYETASKNQAALVTYTYGDWVVGTASIDFTGSLESAYEFDPSEDMYAESDPAANAGDAPAESADNNVDSTQGGKDVTTRETSLFAQIGKWLLKALLILISLIALGLIILLIRRQVVIRRRRRRRRHMTQAIRLSNDPYAMVNTSVHHRRQISEAKRRQRAAEARRRNVGRKARWR